MSSVPLPSQVAAFTTRSTGETGSSPEKSTSARKNGNGNRQRPAPPKKNSPQPVDVDFTQVKKILPSKVNSVSRKDKKVVAASVIYDRKSYHVWASTDPRYFVTPSLPGVVFDLSDYIAPPEPPKPVEKPKVVAPPAKRPKNRW